MTKTASTSAPKRWESIPPLREMTKRTGQLSRKLTSWMRLLPDFVILGAMRAGTTALYEYLALHPNVYPAVVKEVHYFDLNHFRGLTWYRSHFPTLLYKHYVTQVRRQPFTTGEGSPYYLYHPQVPARLRRVLPAAKLIVLLRHPVERAYSHYHFITGMGFESRPFEEAIAREEDVQREERAKLLTDDNYNSYSHQHQSYLARGIYADQLEAWLRLFPREQFLILAAEDLYNDPGATLQQVEQFLGLPPWEPSAFKRANEAKYSSQIQPPLRQQLADYYRPHNQRLYKLLGRDFGWDR